MESLRTDEQDCAKTSPSERNESEENYDGSKSRNGESSSNSTVEENTKKVVTTTVRPYVRSKMQRLRWTPDLHQRFVHAVERLGGQERATPKLVLQMMSIKGLSIAHVKSHLQMYRSKKTDDPNQGGHGNIYNFSQLPMMQGLNQRPLPNFRSYGDHVSWRVHPHPENLVRRPYMGRDGLLYGTLAEKIYGGNNVNTSTNHNSHIASSSSNNNEPSLRIAHEPKLEFKSLHESFTPSKQTAPNPLELPKELNKTINSEILSDGNIKEWKNKPMGRKASDCELDLSLSLKVAKVNDTEEVESDLCLSLYSPSSKQELGKMKERADRNKKHEGRRNISTLDLTL